MNACQVVQDKIYCFYKFQKGATMNKKEQQAQDQQALAARMGKIKHKLVVLSGKGGVGKSTIAANLALAIDHLGKKAGLLDVDIHGPSISEIMGLKNSQFETKDGKNIIAIQRGNLKVVSIGPLLQEKGAAVIWRGPMKHNVIKQFLKDVEWGELDYLVIDSPPGTGDEPLSVCQLIENPTGAIVVTTPQKLALSDVRRSINFCRKLNLPIVGIVENMSGFVCPNCGVEVDIFEQGGGEQLANDMDIPFLGRIPLEPAIVKAGDSGFKNTAEMGGSSFSQYFKKLANAVEKQVLAREKTIQADHVLS